MPRRRTTQRRSDTQKAIRFDSGRAELRDLAAFGDFLAEQLGDRTRGFAWLIRGTELYQRWRARRVYCAICRTFQPYFNDEEGMRCALHDNSAGTTCRGSNRIAFTAHPDETFNVAVTTYEMLDRADANVEVRPTVGTAAHTNTTKGD